MKGYWKILLILMLAVGFASCEDDQGEIEYVITGRAWTGDVGMNAHNGEPLFSTFEFGNDGFGVETQFYASDGLLYDQFHLIRFRQALEQINPAWELIIRLLRINDVKEHLVRLKSLDRTAVFTFAAVADPQFLSLFHTKDIGDMVHIGPCDMDLVRFLINLMRFYKKPLHEISPFLQLRRPIRPAL